MKSMRSESFSEPVTLLRSGSSGRADKLKVLSLLSGDIFIHSFTHSFTQSFVMSHFLWAGKVLVELTEQCCRPAVTSLLWENSATLLLCVVPQPTRFPSKSEQVAHDEKPGVGPAASCIVMLSSLP